jgi:hypothetical protein
MSIPLKQVQDEAVNESSKEILKRKCRAVLLFWMT